MIDADSGTRSSLFKLQVIEKEAEIFNDGKRKPNGKNHIKLWRILTLFKRLGYKNYWDVLNARDYGFLKIEKEYFVSVFLIAMKNPRFHQSENHLFLWTIY